MVIVFGMEIFDLCLICSQYNVMEFVMFLDNYLKVFKVFYFGFVDYFQYFMVCEYLNGGYGVILSFDLIEGVNFVVFLNEMELVICVIYLGDNCIFVLFVVFIIYFENMVEECEFMGIFDIMLCILVGIEDIQDLIVDFEVVLNMIQIMFC